MYKYAYTVYIGTMFVCIESFNHREIFKKHCRLLILFLMDWENKIREKGTENKM